MLLGALAVVAGTVAAPHARLLWWLHLRTELPADLVVPVAGIDTTDLVPSFGVRRSEEHLHEGIDIMAPPGTPVLSVADGVVYEDRPNEKGGNVVWVLGSGRRLYYYAHLREVAEGVRRGRRVRAGERIGAVGNTGNAIRTPSHLHFEILDVTGDFLPLRYRERDPYDELVRRGRSLSLAVSDALPSPPRWSSLPFRPEDALEGDAGAIAAAAREVSSRVEATLAALDTFLGSDADEDARRLAHLQQLAPRLRALADDLETAEGAEGRLHDAPPATRALATRLFLTTEQVDAIQMAWARCRPRDLGVALAGFQGLALGLATPNAGESPAYFFFEGYRPGIVPAAGGWLVAAGASPGREGSAVLVLTRHATDRVVARFPARRLGATALAAWVPAERLAPHAGDCLRLRVERPGADRTPSAGLPLCVPDGGTTRYQLVAWLGYETPSRTVELERQTVRFRNDSCDEPLPVAERLTWDVDEQGELAELGEEVLARDEGAAVACARDGIRIRCQGRLPSARCKRAGGDGASVVRATEWASAFAPTLSVPSVAYTSHGRSASLPADGRPLCATLGRDLASETTTIRFQLVAANGGQRRVFFESPIEEIGSESDPRYEEPPHRIEASLRAGDAEQPGEVCVRIESEACGF